MPSCSHAPDWVLGLRNQLRATLDTACRVGHPVLVALDQLVALLELLLHEIASRNCLGMTMRFKDSSLREIYSYFE